MVKVIYLRLVLLLPALFVIILWFHHLHSQPSLPIIVSQLPTTIAASQPIALPSTGPTISRPSKPLPSHSLSPSTSRKVENKKLPNKVATPTQPFTNLTTSTLLAHPYFKLKQPLALHVYMQHLSKQKKCFHRPIIVSMAKVISPLYWQLIENFYSTMLRFDLYECAVMICISDAKCIDSCRKNHYPW